MKVTRNKAIQWLRDYKGNNSFYHSLHDQWVRTGHLSPKQLACVEKMVLATKLTHNEFTYRPGDKIMIGRWIANTLRKEKNIPFFFRNLIIKEQHSETEKAIQVTVNFNDKPATNCHVCGLPLDNEISQVTGIGPICIGKYLGLKKPSIAESQMIMAKITEECRLAGDIGPIWIPKSQIK